jgi:cyanophycin synthetase
MSDHMQDIKLPPRAGYRHGLSQPSLKISLALDCPPTVALSTIDDWLENAFSIKLMQLPLTGSVARTTRESEVAGLAWRVMHLGAALLQAVRVPVFDVGQILAMRSQGSGTSTWHCMLAMSRIDYVQDAHYTLAYQHAAKAIQWLSARAYTPANVESLFTALNEQFVKRVKPQIYGGESTLPVLQVAWKKEIEFRHLGHGTYQLGIGARQLRIDRGAIQFDSAIGAQIAHNKWRSANLARNAGLPAPTHMTATSEDAALTIAHNLGWPVVIKPLDRDRGEGVTVDIRSDQQLVEAFKKAAALSPSVLVERQVPGVCHRILVAQGKVCIAAKRLPKSVKGDGRRTVLALVDLANAEEQAKPPWSRLKPFPLDEMALACLSAAGFTPNSIPPEGAMVPLRPIQTSEWGGVVEYLTDKIHPDNAAIAIKSARIFGLAVAGIDMISTDITRPWHENGAIINEVNFSPLLNDRQDGTMIGSLLDRWLTDGGYIPVEAVIGGESAMAEGLRIRDHYSSQGIRCWLTNHMETVSDSGEQSAVAALGLYGRCMALLLDPEVEALIMVIQTDELLGTGLPFRRIGRIHGLPDVHVPPSEASAHRQIVPVWTDAMRKLLLAHTAAGENSAVQRTDSI